MKIVKGFPPNIDEIRDTFKLSGREIFAWGDTIYNPQGGELPPWLVAHEKVHKGQQEAMIHEIAPHTYIAGAGGPETWWERYLRDTKFRFDQELEAHQEEYRVFCKHHPDRNQRRAGLKSLAKRLSGKMYGNMVSFDKAKRMIKDG